MKRYLYLIFLIIICDDLLAQAPNMNVEIARSEFKTRQAIPPAPEAAELGKYGNTQVTLFTGSPNISVPIYELKGQFLSVPVSLSYNTGGFKPEDPATWVGLNWSLNAGGVVTRAVVGNPDVPTTYFGSGFLQPPASTDMYAYNDWMHDVKVGMKETTPDFYTYNFAGFTGKFFILPDYSIVKKERNNLKIDQCMDCTSSYMRITDENGNKYQFADVEATRTVADDQASTDAPLINSYNYNSSWYLSSVTSVNGREVMLFEYYTTSEHPLTQNSRTNRSATYSTTYTEASPGFYKAPTFSQEATTITPPAVYATQKFLKRITLLRDSRIIGYIDFESAANLREDADFTENRLLQRIKVYSTLNNVANLIKDFKLNYSYFANTSNTFTKKRLRLDSLQELAVGSGTVSKPPYRFEYNTSGVMPERYSYSLDHWGFYNAAPNQSLVPTIAVDDQNSYGEGANREPDLEATSYGIINKMKYPTGGYTTFEYELHDALNNDRTTRSIGGLRIKKITDYASDGQKAIAKKYSYTLADSDTTSGNSTTDYPRYDNLTSFTHSGQGVATEVHDPTYTTAIYSISANSIFTLGSLAGSHIGYSRVTESQEDVFNGNLLGKTVYNYNIGNFFSQDEDITNGELLKQTTYDNNGKVLEELTNSYTYQLLNTVNTIQVKTQHAQNNKINLCKKTDASGTTYTRYATFNLPSNCDQVKVYYTWMFMTINTLKSEEKRLVQQTMKKYDQLTNTYIQQIRKNTYSSTAHTYPTLIEDYTTGNEVVVTRKKYAGDYTLPGGSTVLDNTAKGIYVLQTNNMVGTEIESVQFRQNPDSSNRRYIGGQITNYGTFYPVPVSTSRLETATPLTALTESTVNSSGVFVSDSHYKPLGVFGYDGNGDLTEQAKANDAIQSFVWDYNDSYTVAAVSNSNLSAIAYSSFETDTIRGSGGWINEATSTISTYAFTGKRACNLGTGRVYRLFTTAISKPVIVAYWSRNGAITVKQNNTTNIAATTTGSTVNGWTYYEHLLPTSTTQVAVSGTNAIIDELRLYPEEAQMTTYTYEPLVGVSSQTDSKGMPVNYEYDGLGRLMNVKDEKGAIRQNLKYNYGPGATIVASAPTLFYNRDSAVNFTKIGCSVGEPELITYRVPAGKYASAVSQADVTSKVTQDIIANGQTYANTVGRCLFYNVETIKKLVKNDCPPENGLGKLYTYTVPARKYNSDINQAAADTLAARDIRDNAQTAANKYGHCDCDGEGKKLVNSICETGTRVNIGSWLQPDGQWKCVYVYHFSDNTDSAQYTEYNTTQCPVL